MVWFKCLIKLNCKKKAVVTTKKRERSSPFLFAPALGTCYGFWHAVNFKKKLKIIIHL